MTNINFHITLVLDFECLNYDSWRTLFLTHYQAYDTIDHVDVTHDALTAKAINDNWKNIDAVCADVDIHNHIPKSPSNCSQRKLLHNHVPNSPSNCSQRKLLHQKCMVSPGKTVSRQQRGWSSATNKWNNIQILLIACE